MPLPLLSAPPPLDRHFLQRSHPLNAFPAFPLQFLRQPQRRIHRVPLFPLPQSRLSFECCHAVRSPGPSFEFECGCPMGLGTLPGTSFASSPELLKEYIISMPPPPPPPGGGGGADSKKCTKRHAFGCLQAFQPLISPPGSTKGRARRPLTLSLSSGPAPRASPPPPHPQDERAPTTDPGPDKTMLCRNDVTDCPSQKRNPVGRRPARAGGERGRQIAGVDCRTPLRRETILVCRARSEAEVRHGIRHGGDGE